MHTWHNHASTPLPPLFHGVRSCVFRPTSRFFCDCHRSHRARVVVPMNPRRQQQYVNTPTSLSFLLQNRNGQKWLRGCRSAPVSLSFCAFHLSLCCLGLRAFASRVHIHRFAALGPGPGHFCIAREVESSTRRLFHEPQALRWSLACGISVMAAHVPRDGKSTTGAIEVETINKLHLVRRRLRLHLTARSRSG